MDSRQRPRLAVLNHVSTSSVRSQYNNYDLRHYPLHGTNKYLRQVKLRICHNVEKLYHGKLIITAIRKLIVDAECGRAIRSLPAVVEHIWRFETG